VAYERDGILFDKVEYSWEVLSGIMWVAAQNKSSINVMDIGGSLGTTFFQNKAFFKNINLVSWNIIEQPNYVRAGKSNIEDEVIKFYSTVEDCLQNSSPNIVLISSSLQYMHNADIILNTLINIETEVIIFDRTIIQDSNINKIFVQYAPKSIGGSYPCYSISESWLFNKLNKNFKLLVDFESLPFPELEAINSKFKGYIFIKK
jgi:putative methyltransferase (TIGR04325 family)